jgi:taurine dioxygenase
MKIAPLSDALGAEVTGIDLRKPVSAADQVAMDDAFAEHLVLVVRDQDLTPAEYVAATKLFGEPTHQYFSDMIMEGQPEIIVLDSRDAPILPNGEPRLVGSGAWHTDHTNTPCPPKATVLYAIKLPSSGGTTGFANMRKAYAALPQEERTQLDGMKTVNTLVENPDYISDEDREEFSKPCIHPLARTHPVSGDKAIWVGPVKVERIEGMEPEESRKFIDDLLERVVQPDVIYRHQWKKGDLLMWDNRAVLHKAFRDYDHTEGRVMQRVILEGDVPF